MPTIIIEHTIEDFANWNPIFEGHEPTRNQYGITNPHVFRSASDPNRVCIIMQAESIDKVNDFLNNSDLPDVMEKAGVVGEPTVRILEEVTVAPPA